MEQMRASERATILLFAGHSIDAVTRSGIQRVVVGIARGLVDHCNVSVVKWDPLEGQLAYCSHADLADLFRDELVPPGLKASRFSGRVRYRFGDTLPDNRDRVWLLLPEISYHARNGVLETARAVAQAREYRTRVASIFYDLIPITNPSYSSLSAQHELYVKELLKQDLIFPISRHSETVLNGYFDEVLGISAGERAASDQRIVPLLLPDPTVLRRDDLPLDLSKRDCILVLGTVEPRKQQIAAVRAFIVERCGERFGLTMVIVGSLHGDVADEFLGLVSSNSHIEYRGYASDSDLDQFFSRARFTVFASNDEGFGLPICESVARQVPCLTANFGSMAEIAQDGGCLTVDVNDPRELARGMRTLATDDALLLKLVEECRTRAPRDWSDYAQELVAELEASTDRSDEIRARSDLDQALNRLISSDGLARATGRWKKRSGMRWSLDRWKSTCAGTGAPVRADERAADMTVTVVFLPESADALAGIEAGALRELARADIWLAADPETYALLIEQAGKAGIDTMLPTRWVAIEPQSASHSKGTEAIGELLEAKSRRRLIAAREGLLEMAAKASPPPRDECLLHLIISTYNRGPFVEENVRWLLPLIQPFAGRVRLTVVDNTSTDDTLARLAPFTSSPHFNVVCNPTNVGMLGNLRVCSSLSAASHSWVIGDDDFITPEGLSLVVEAVEVHPDVPFVFGNMGVYHRFSLSPGDCAAMLVNERIVLAPYPSPSGLYKVKHIAEEHDNLFTAVYPIVFRSDILSACFNYPFDGVPFSDLVESIPTTKIVLESYGDTQAVWLAEPIIIGNSHNSWRHHALRWHGHLLPVAWELAREVGVQPELLQRWSKHHVSLFENALAQYASSATRFAPEEIEGSSFRVFRKRLLADVSPQRN